MDFWARGAFHRGRRLTRGEVAPNVLRKAARKVQRSHGVSDREYITETDDKDRYVPNRVVIHPPRRNSKGEWV